jgi:hypothetical protein
MVGGFFSNSRPVAKILNVEELTPDLDVDLGIESIEHPERFPLTARAAE